MLQILRAIMSIKQLAQFLRLPNLLIMAVTQYLIQYWVIVPALVAHQLSPTLSFATFGGLVLYTLLIAGAGNIINDILDAPIDQINKPDKVFIGRVLSSKTAYGIYCAMNGLAIVIAICLDVISHQFLFTPIGIIIILLLYWYSATFKRQVLIGNLIIALLCAFVAVIVWWANEVAITQLTIIDEASANSLSFLLLIYTLFAFLSTMYREIVKDMQDIEGDEQQGCRTLPIATNLITAKWIAFLFGLTLVVSLAFPVLQLLSQQKYLGLSYLNLFIILPLLFSFWQLKRATNPTDFKQLSSLIKWIMLGGLGLLFAL